MSRLLETVGTFGSWTAYVDRPTNAPVDWDPFSVQVALLSNGIFEVGLNTYARTREGASITDRILEGVDTAPFAQLSLLSLCCRRNIILTFGTDKFTCQGCQEPVPLKEKPRLRLSRPYAQRICMLETWLALKANPLEASLWARELDTLAQDTTQKLGRDHE